MYKTICVAWKQFQSNAVPDSSINSVTYKQKSNITLNNDTVNYSETNWPVT